MSKTVDNRVVSMEFDNAKFEKNVEQSLNTLKSLDESLNGMIDSSVKFDNISFNSISSAIEDLASNFTFLGTLTRTIFQEISESIVDVANKMVSISTSGISDGMQKYADKTSAVQQIMAATGDSIEDVNAALERLNWYTDETSYNFVDMTGNIAKFTAQNIGLEEAEAAMEGIANWAASAGQRATTASRAMYNISQSMGAGYMMATDWRSIELANMATSEFKQIAIETALAMGTLEQNADGVITTLEGNEVSVENFRENLKDKWFSKDVMMNVFGQYSGFNDIINEMTESTGMTTSQLLTFAEAMENGTTSAKELSEEVGVSTEKINQYREYVAQLNDEEYALSKKAFKMAQEATTFTDAINAFSDAYSTAWMNIFELLFGNYEKARKLWTNLANGLYDIFVEPVNSLLATLDEGLGHNANEIENTITSMGVSLEDFVAGFKASDKNKNLISEEQLNSIETFDDLLSSSCFNVSTYKYALEELADTSGVNKQFESTEEAIKALQEVVSDVWRGDYGNGSARISALEELGYDAKYIQDLVDKGEWYKVGESDLSDEWLKTVQYTEEEIAAIREAAGSAEDLRNEFGEIEKISGAEHLQRGYKNLIDTAVGFAQTMRDGFSEVFDGDYSELVYKIAEKFDSATEKAKDFVNNNETLKKTITGIAKLFKNLFTIVKKVISIFTPLTKIFKSLVSVTGVANASILEVINGFLDWILNSELLQSTIDTLAQAVEWISTKVSDFIERVKELDIIRDAAGWFENLKKNIEEMGVLNAFIEEFKKIGELDIIKEVTEWFQNLKNEFSELEIYDTLKQKFDDLVTAILGLEIVNDAKIWFENFRTRISEVGIFDAITEEFDAFKESIQNGTFYEKFLKVVEDIKESFNNLSIIKDAKTWFEDFRKEVSEVGYLETFRQKFNDLWDSLKKNRTIQTIITKIESLWTKLNDLEIIKDVKKWFSDFFSGDIINWSNLLDKLGTAFQTIVGAIAGLISLIFGGGNETLDEAFGSISGTKVSNGSGAIEGMSNAIGNLGSSLETLAQNKDTTAFIESLTDSFTSVSDTVTPFIDRIKEGLAKFSEFLTLPNITAIAGFASLIISLKALTKLMTSFNNLFNLKNSLSSFFSSLSSGIKQLVKNSKFDVVVKIAAAILILVGAIAALCMLNSQYNVWEAVAQLTVLTAAIFLLTALTYKFSELAQTNGPSVVKGVMALGSAAIALVTLASTLAVISAIDLSGITLTKIGLVIGATVLMVALTKIAPGANKNKLNGVYSIAAMALAIVAAAAAIMLISKMDISLGKNAIKSLIVVVGLMAVLALAAKNVKASSGLGLITYVIAILLFEKYLQKIIDNAISFDVVKENLLNLLTTIALLLLFAGVAKLAGSNSWSGGVAIISLVLSLLVLSSTIEKLGSIDTNVLIKGGLAISALSVIFGIVAKLVSSLSTIKKEGLTALIAIIAGIATLCVATMFLSSFTDTTKLIIVVLAIVSMLSALGRVVSQLKAMKVEGSAVGTLLVITLLIAGLITAMALLAKLRPGDVESYRTIAASMVLLMTDLAAVMWVLSKCEFKDIKFKTWISAIGQLAIILAAACGLLMFASKEIGSVDLKVIGSLMALIAELAGVMYVISKLKPQVNKNNQFKKWLGPIIAFVAIALLAMAALAVVNTIDSVDPSVLIALVSLIATFTGALWAISKIKPTKIDSSAQTWAESLGSLAAIAVIAYLVLLFINNTITGPVDTKNILLIESLIAVLSGALWVISKSSAGTEKIPWQNWGQNILSLVIIAGIAVGAMAILSAFNINPDASAIVALESLIGVLTGALWVISKTQSSSGDITFGQWAAQVGALLAIVVIASAAIIAIANLVPDPSVVTNIALGLSAMIIALAIAMAVVSVIPKFDTGKAAAMIVAGLAMIPLAAALALFGWAISEFNIDTTKLLEGVGSMAVVIIALALAMGIMSLMKVDMAAALEGMGTIGIVLGLFIIIIGAVAAAITELISSGVITEQQVEDFGNLMVKIAETLGLVIGAFVGGLVGGFNLGATSTLATVATNLSDFSNNLQPFMDNIKAWGAEIGSITAGIGVVGEIFIALAAADMLAALQTVLDFFGLANFDTLKTDFKKLGEAIKSFTDLTSDIKVSKVTAAIRVLDAFKEIYPYVDSEGGIVSSVIDFLVGNKDFEGLKNGMTAMGEGVVAFYDSIPESFGDTELDRITKFTAAFTGIVDAVKLIPNSGGLVGLIVGENDVDTFMTKISGAVTSTAGALNTIKDNKEVFDQGPELVEPFVDVINKFNDAAKDLVNTGGWAGAIFGENDIDSFARHVRSSVTPMGAALKLLISYEDQFTNENLDSIIDGFSTSVKKLNTCASDITNSGGWVGTIFGENDIDTFANAIKNSVEPMATALEQMGEFTEAFSGSENAVEEFVNTINALAEAEFKDVHLDFKGVFTTIINDMKSYGKRVGNAFIRGLENSEDSMRTSLGTIMKNVRESIDLEEFAKFGSTIAESIAEGIEEERTQFSFAILKCIASLIQAVQDYDVVLTNTGGYIVAGLVAGMYKYSNMVYYAGQYLASQANKGVTDRAQICSPSKEFYKLGEYIGEGLVNGINSEGDEVYNATNELTGIALTSAINMINAVQAAIDSDNQVTITPVLDLSEVESNASEIGSLLNGNYNLEANKLNALKTSSIIAHNATIQNGSENTTSVVSLDADSLSALRDQKIDVNNTISFEGSLAQLGTLLYPVIKKEENRRGTSLLKSGV